MSDKPRSFEHDELRMRAYLLGELPPSESADVETQVFDNDADYDRLLDAQYDLIDAYARGTLTASERESVEQRLLAHPDGRRHVTLARALSVRAANAAAVREVGAVHEPPLQRRSTSQPPIHGVRNLGPMRLAAAAIFVLAAAGLTWLGLENARLRRELNARAASPPIVQPTSSPVTTVADASIPAVAELALTDRVTRSERAGERATRTVEIASSARLVRVRLEVNDTAPSFTVAVERAGTGRVWTQSHDGTRQEGGVVVWLPAEILQSGDYEILLWREREAPDSLVGAYPFKIVRD